MQSKHSLTLVTNHIEKLIYCNKMVRYIITSAYQSSNRLTTLRRSLDETYMLIGCDGYWFDRL